MTLTATYSKAQKQAQLPIRYLYFNLSLKPLINKEVIKVFQNYAKYTETDTPLRQITPGGAADYHKFINFGQLNTDKVCLL